MSICPGIVVAGLSGDSGKTLVALGLAAAWAKQGLRVAPFKKGPDYIDAAWLTLAAGTPCRNLDTFLMTGDRIRDTWRRESRGADVALIEGNRGVFDGMDVEGSHSTATLAKLLGVPVLLVVNATKMTRTTAALVLGVKTLDPNLRIAGVVLNRVAGNRHANVASGAVEMFAGVPVVGVIPKLKGGELIPGRHLGLVTTDEHPATTEAIARAAEVVEEHLDLDLICQLAGGAEESLIHGEAHRRASGEEAPAAGGTAGATPLRIGVVRDAAFPFYYPENLEALEQGGAQLVRISALGDTKVPEDLDALYVGGGFPETHAHSLAANRLFLASLKQRAEEGLPIYAECGGLMLLAESIEFDGVTTPMAGVLPIKIGWSKKPAGHGYSEGEVDTENPFYPVGTKIRGHEFHHSLLLDEGGERNTAVAVGRGTGVGGGRDGLLKGNVLALYTHIHAAGMGVWADGMLRAAATYRDARLKADPM